VNLLSLSAQCIIRLNIDTSNFILQKPGKESRIGEEQFAACQKFKPFSYVPSFPRRGKKKDTVQAVIFIYL
jgi:hypothetical protein